MRSHKIRHRRRNIPELQLELEPLLHPPTADDLAQPSLLTGLAGAPGSRGRSTKSSILNLERSNYQQQAYPMSSKKAQSSCQLVSNCVWVTGLPQSIVDVRHRLAEEERNCSSLPKIIYCFLVQHLDTQGSGGMGACMLRVSLRLVCPFTLIVSYLGMDMVVTIRHNLEMRERGTQTRSDHLEASSGEMCLRPGCSCQATIITIKEEEHEDGAWRRWRRSRRRRGGFNNWEQCRYVDSKQHYLPLDRSPQNHLPQVNSLQI